MELFSVTCITCRAKIKARHVSAVGQILACPRCGGMVQITPPPGWKPPVAEPEHPQPQSGSAASPAAAGEEVRTAQVYAEPLAPPTVAAAPREQAVRRMILAGAALVALLIVGFGLWSSFGGSDEEAPAPAGPAVAQAVTGAKPKSSPTAMAASSTPQPSATAAVPKPSASTPPATVARATAAPPTATASATAPPSAVATASAPVAKPMASARPLVFPPPQPSASATAARPAPASVATPGPAAPDAAVQARLASQTIPSLRFDRTPLRSVVAVLSELSAVRINYDWDTLPAGFRLDEPVSLTLENGTVATALTQLVAGRGWRVDLIGDQFQIAGPAPQQGLSVVEYPIDDLAGADAAAAESLAQLVRRFVAPTSWNTMGAAGNVVAVSGKLAVSQSAAVHAETAQFLDRLRLARGKSPRGPAQSGAAPTLDTRLSRAKTWLERPVTMNFRPAAPLPVVAARIESTSGARLTLDYLALGAAAADEPIGIAADKHPLAAVLDALCDPHDWGWRIVTDEVVEITTREAVQRRTYLEFYDVRRFTADGLTPETLSARVKAQTVDLAWTDSGGRGDLAYDELSGRLIVRQDQAGHRRLERLWHEWSEAGQPRPAAGGLSLPTPSASTKPAATPSPTALPARP